MVEHWKHCTAMKEISAMIERERDEEDDPKLLFKIDLGREFWRAVENIKTDILLKTPRKSLKYGSTSSKLQKFLT